MNILTILNMRRVKMVEAAKKKVGGLAGIVAGDSAICICGAEEQSLTYRGYSIEDLAAHATFEEVAWLLLRGELPNQKQLKEYRARLKKLRVLPQPLMKVLTLIPTASSMMDVLRTGVSFLGNLEPVDIDQHPFDGPDRLIACLGPMLLYWYLYHQKRHGTQAR